MKYFVIALAALATVVYAAPSGPQCQAPNGGGLTPALKEFVDLLPVEKLASIYMTAVTSDAEVQKVVAYVSSEDFHKVLKAIHKAPVFIKLVNFYCKQLYLDVAYYYNQAASLLGLPQLPPQANLKEFSAAVSRPGFVGMLQDMLEVIPVEKIRQLFEEKVKTDEYMKKAIDMMKSDDFKSMVKLVHDVPEYQQMLTKLRGMGVEVDKVRETLKKFFGWQ